MLCLTSCLDRSVLRSLKWLLSKIDEAHILHRAERRFWDASEMLHGGTLGRIDNPVKKWLQSTRGATAQMRSVESGG